MSLYNSSALSNSNESDKISRNVFVTQINEREGESQDCIIQHGIVKESPSKLLKTGLNTYQTTLVVKKENELSHIDSDLFIKRKEYEREMTNFARKKQELIVKQQSLLDQMKSFESFIKENDAKRERALVKYQKEVRLINQQTLIEKDLQKEIGDTKILHEKLLKKVQRNKKYEEFLLKVVELLPPDYIKVSENVLGGLIMRYNTLFATNELLLADMSAKSEENQYYTSLIAKLKEDNSREILQNNYRLSKMYEEYENLKEQLERGEQNFKIKHGDVRTDILNFGLILRAIDNITKKCTRRFDETFANDAIENKLQRIENYIITNNQIIEMVNQSKEKSNIHLTTIPQKSIKSANAKSLVNKSNIDEAH